MAMRAGGGAIRAGVGVATRVGVSTRSKTRPTKAKRGIRCQC